MITSALLRAGACAVLVAGVICAPLSQAQTAPRYEAVVGWPKPLPDRWVLGGLGGNCVDEKDHVLILNRQDVQDGDLHAGRMAPPIIELDPAGNVVNAWGDLNILDPRLHSCHVDKDGNVWLASAAVRHGAEIHARREEAPVADRHQGKAGRPTRRSA